MHCKPIQHIGTAWSNIGRTIMDEELKFGVIFLPVEGNEHPCSNPGFIWVPFARLYPEVKFFTNFSLFLISPHISQNFLWISSNFPKSFWIVQSSGACYSFKFYFLRVHWYVYSLFPRKIEPVNERPRLGTFPIASVTYFQYFFAIVSHYG